MLRTDKEKTINELKEKLSTTKSLFLTDFRGLNVLEINQLRRELKKGGAEYEVAKNTMIRRAAQDTEFEMIRDHLKGPTGLVFSYENPVSPAKVLFDLFKKVEKPKVKVIWMDGRLLDQDYLKKLAALPSREVLLTQILGGINSPLTNLVGTLQGVMRNFVGVIDALKEEKSKAA
jgi:large subunit ribosomal protein L10